MLTLRVRQLTANSTTKAFHLETLDLFACLGFSCQHISLQMAYGDFIRRQHSFTCRGHQPKCRLGTPSPSSTLLLHMSFLLGHPGVPHLSLACSSALRVHWLPRSRAKHSLGAGLLNGHSEDLIFPCFQLIGFFKLGPPPFEHLWQPPDTKTTGSLTEISNAPSLGSPHFMASSVQPRSNKLFQVLSSCQHL